MSAPEDPMPEAEYCIAVTHPGFPGNNHRPPEPMEFCDGEAVEGSDFCEGHLWMDGE